MIDFKGKTMIFEGARRHIRHTPREGAVFIPETLVPRGMDGVEFALPDF